jgi:hypothetical protein
VANELFAKAFVSEAKFAGRFHDDSSVCHGASCEECVTDRGNDEIKRRSKGVLCRRDDGCMTPPDVACHRIGERCSAVLEITRAQRD